MKLSQLSKIQSKEMSIIEKFKITKMKNHEDFSHFDRKSAKAGFDQRMYEKMKKAASKVRYMNCHNLILI
jgi:hypothetical protein